MEKIEVEVKEIRFKAVDGTVFKNEYDCQRYEDTADCVIRQRFMSIVEKTINPYDENLCENSYNGEGYIVVLSDKEKIDIVNMYLRLRGDDTISYDKVSHIIIVIYNTDSDYIWHKDLTEQLNSIKSIIDSVDTPF